MFDLNLSTCLGLGLLVYLIHLAIIGPYFNALKQKKLYGDKIYSFWFPFLGFLRIIFRSITKYGTEGQIMVNISRKYPKAKLIYGSGLSFQDFWVLLDADYHKLMLQNQQLYTKSDQFLFLKKKYFDIGLVFSDGNDWKRQRQIISDAFHFQALKRYTPLINKVTDSYVNKVKVGEMHKIVDTCSMIPGKVIAATFFDEEFSNGSVNGQPIVREIQELFQSLGDHKKTVWHLIKYSIFENYTNYSFLTTKYEKSIINRMEQLKKYILNHVENLIQKGDQIKENQEATSFSQILVSQYFKNKVSKDEIVMNFATFFFAGIDTTGNFTAMAMYVLGREQQIQQRVYESCYQYFQKKFDGKFDPQNFEVEHSDLNQIQDLNNYIKEMFRFHNSTPGLVFRNVLKDHEIDGIKIKKGSILTCMSHCNLKNEKYFKNPDNFDIDRWEREETKSIDPFAYIPFSSGQRNCLGQHLALIEIKIMIIKFLMKYKILKNPNKDMIVGFRLVVCPLEDNLVYFEERQK